MVSSRVLLVLSVLCGVAISNSTATSYTHNGCSGWISSPDFPATGNGNVSINYAIQVPNQHVIKLEMVMVDLERSFNCYYKDRLAIYDSDDVGAPLIAAICSFENDNNGTYWSSGSTAFIRYTGRHHIHRRGFLMSYVAVTKPGAANPCRLFPPPSNGCDGGLKVISLKSAALTSPQYPSLYPSDATCLYKIDMSAYGNTTWLSWNDFSLERRINCVKDWLRIYDPLKNEAYGPYCGYSHPGDQLYDSPVLYILFKTNSESNHRGFSVSISPINNAAPSRMHEIQEADNSTTGGPIDASLIYVPKSGQKDLTDKRDGYIISPGYPSQYPDEADGKLRITASTEAEKTWFIFIVEHLDVEKATTYSVDECYDFLTISFDGNLKHKLCGRNGALPEPFAMRATAAELRFKSDSVTTHTGFRIKFRIVDNFQCGRPAVGPCLPTPSNNSQCVNTTDGQYALLHSHPWQAAVVSPTGRLRCTGAILHPEWVAVAAHCVKLGMQGAVVQSGSRNVIGALRNSSISQVIKHPDFVEASYDYDIALLRLEEPLVFGEQVSAICLPGSLNLTGANASITNWGSGDERHTVDRIRESQVTIMPHRECFCRYGGDVVTDRVSCATFSSEELCHSDSVGPLVVRSPDGSYSLAGIPAVGMLCSNRDKIAVFTNITAVNDWLVSNMVA